MDAWDVCGGHKEDVKGMDLQHVPQAEGITAGGGNIRLRGVTMQVIFGSFHHYQMLC